MVNDKAKQFEKVYKEVYKSVNQQKAGYEISVDLMIYEFELEDNYVIEDNSYIIIGRKKVGVESIWHDGSNVMIHVEHDEFEGDIIFKTLSRQNQLRLMKLMRQHFHKQNYGISNV